MSKHFRPFWSYRISSTEQWLEKQVLKGKKLKHISRTLRIFTFEESEEKTPSTIRLLYKFPILSPSLESSGWKQTIKSGNWTIFENKNKDIDCYPLEDFAWNRLRKHVVLIVFLLLILITLLSIIITFKGYPEVIILTGVVISVVLGLLMYFYSKQELKFFNVQLTPIIREDAYEQLYNWNNKLDVTLKMLEQKDNEGYRLLGIQKDTFSFEKKKDKSIRTTYELDFNWNVDRSYFSSYQKLGWMVIYTGISFGNLTLWAKDYSEEEYCPQFYKGFEEKYNSRKKDITFKVTLYSFVLFIFIVGLLLIIFSSNYLYYIFIPLCMLRILIVQTIQIITSFQEFKKLQKESSN